MGFKDILAAAKHVAATTAKRVSKTIEVWSEEVEAARHMRADEEEARQFADEVARRPFITSVNGDEEKALRFASERIVAVSGPDTELNKEPIDYAEHFDSDYEYGVEEDKASMPPKSVSKAATSKFTAQQICSYIENEMHLDGGAPLILRPAQRELIGRLLECSGSGENGTLVMQHDGGSGVTTAILAMAIAICQLTTTNAGQAGPRLVFIAPSTVRVSEARKTAQRLYESISNPLATLTLDLSHEMTFANVCSIGFIPNLKVDALRGIGIDWLFLEEGAHMTNLGPLMHNLACQMRPGAVSLISSSISYGTSHWSRWCEIFEKSNNRLDLSKNGPDLKLIELKAEASKSKEPVSNETQILRERVKRLDTLLLQEKAERMGYSMSGGPDSPVYVVSADDGVKKGKEVEIVRQLVEAQEAGHKRSVIDLTPALQVWATMVNQAAGGKMVVWSPTSVMSKVSMTKNPETGATVFGERIYLEVDSARKATVEDITDLLPGLTKLDNSEVKSINVSDVLNPHQTTYTEPVDEMTEKLDILTFDDLEALINTARKVAVPLGQPNNLEPEASYKARLEAALNSTLTNKTGESYSDFIKRTAVTEEEVKLSVPEDAESAEKRAALLKAFEDNKDKE